MREYKTLKALRRGETIDFEGVPIQMVGEELQPGDTYIGERNVGPKLLTVKEIFMSSCSACSKEAKENSCTTCGGPFRDHVVPVEPGYCYDYGECVKVTLVE